MKNKKSYYRAFSEVLKTEFGTKVYKIPLDVGFTCPNRDGSVSLGGCIYCDEAGSGPGQEKSSQSISLRLDLGKKVMQKRYKCEKYIAYFQAFTGTYTKPETLKAFFDEALCDPDIIGLSVATRPDCLAEEMIKMLEIYHKKTYLWIELGLQTANDEVLKKVNRGHTVACFIDAVERIKKRGMRVCAHFVIGLPGDDTEHLYRGAEIVGAQGIDAVKLHHLYITKGAPIASAWKKGFIKTMDLEEYARLAVDFLERIPQEVIIQRLFGSSTKDKLLAPAWTLNRSQSQQAIVKEFIRRGTRQGYLYEKNITNPNRHKENNIDA
ncbi:MAG: TIGR01212 family radical SAM protein [Chlamydiota bacterium]|nr:TIGR01212 family radical SAM protein [Chlamydiota bacterium]